MDIFRLRNKNHARFPFPLIKFLFVMLAFIFVKVAIVYPQASNMVPKKQVLRLLVWEGYAPPQDLATFSQEVLRKHNVKLKFVIKNASNPDDFFNELRKGAVEMISPAHNLPKDPRYNLMTNGLTLPINLENIPNYRHITQDLQHQPWAIERESVYAVPVLQGPYGLAYNSDIIKEEPKSWDVLWDPQYKGRYIVANDYYELNMCLCFIIN